MSDLSNTLSYALLPTQISLNQTSALSRRCRCGPSMPDIMLQSPCVMLCRNIVLPSACHVPSLMLSAYASKAAGTASSDHSAGRTVILEILVTSQVLTEITYSESPLLTASCQLVMNLQIQACDDARHKWKGVHATSLMLSYAVCCALCCIVAVIAIVVPSLLPFAADVEVDAVCRCCLSFPDHTDNVCECDSMRM